MKVTAAQKRALKKCFDSMKKRYEEQRWKDSWFSAYDVGESLATLRALNNRGLLNRRAGLGSLFSPRTHIDFRLTPKGLLLVRQWAAEESKVSDENSLVSADTGAGRVSIKDELDAALTAQHSARTSRCKILGHEKVTGAHGRITCVVCGKRFA